MSGFGIAGVRVGHWTDAEAETGCTVVELPVGTVASYEARGGAPASRELVVLEPDKTVAVVDAVLLTGGSAFGLAAADGVMRFLEAGGRGVVTTAGRVPIVPTMALFDLAVGDASVRPDAASGFAAAGDLAVDAVLHGRVGVGAGAYVGHWRGDGRRPAGLGHAVRTMGDVTVGALCAVNAFGDIDHGGAEPDLAAVAALPRLFEAGRTHTTIGVVVTNAKLDKAACRIVAQGAHDGLARAITPPHTASTGTPSSLRPPARSTRRWTLSGCWRWPQWPLRSVRWTWTRRSRHRHRHRHRPRAGPPRVHLLSVDRPTARVQPTHGPYDDAGASGVGRSQHAKNCRTPVSLSAQTERGCHDRADVGAIARRTVAGRRVGGVPGRGRPRR